MGNEKLKPETSMITSGKLEPDVKANCECACASLGNAVCAGFSIILTAFVKLLK